MNKKDLSETDIRTKLITPAITNAGWDIQTQIREEVSLTSGKILVKGNRHKCSPAKFADYILHHKPNLPIAVVEAKSNKHCLGMEADSYHVLTRMLVKITFVPNVNKRH
jgi:type I restriction enzyme, R subunit